MHIILKMLVVAKALKLKCFHLSNTFVGLVVLCTSLFSSGFLKNRYLTDQGHQEIILQCYMLLTPTYNDFPLRLGGGVHYIDILQCSYDTLKALILSGIKQKKNSKGTWPVVALSDSSYE